jgi:uncharacterized LabA/DUF88 family protein
VANRTRQEEQVLALASFQRLPGGRQRWFAGRWEDYKASVDVLLAVDAIELSVEMRPEVVVLVTGDADFAHLALQLRRRGIRVEVAATPQTLGTGLKGAANEVIDLVPLFESFELMRTGE